MKAQKPVFSELEQRTTPQGQRSNLHFDPMINASAYGQIGQALGNAGEVLQKMQDRNDKLAMSAWEQKLADDEKTLRYRLENTNSPEEIDTLYKEYEQNTLTQAKERLGTRLFDKWKRETGDTYLEITQQMSQRAKFPIMQRKGLVDLQENLRLLARNRSMAQTQDERQGTDEAAFASINYAAYPQDGAPAIINDLKRAELIQNYKNDSDLYDVEAVSKTHAKEALRRLQGGYYKNLTPEQVQKLTVKVEKLADEQEQEDLYNAAWPLAQKNLSGALKKINDFAEQGKVKPINAKAATDMIYANYNRQVMAQRLEESQAKADVLNNAYGYFLNGDSARAVQAVAGSNLPNDTKYEIIKNFTSASNTAPKDDSETYSQLMRGIIDGSIYDQTPILEALAAGKIKETSKDAMLQTLKQKQAPSFELYQNAIKQVDKVYTRGLLGGLTDAESVALSKIHAELNALYLDSLAHNKDLESIRNIFSPENVSRIAEKHAVGIAENSESYSKRFQVKEKDKNKAVDNARKPGESVDEWLKRTGGTL